MPVLEAWQGGWPGKAAATMEALGSVLSCPVCLELFTPPVLLLSCSHNFCKQCLELILVCQHCTHVDGQFCCPVCRKVRVLGSSTIFTTEAADFFLVGTPWDLSHERTGDGWPTKWRLAN